MNITTMLLGDSWDRLMKNGPGDALGWSSQLSLLKKRLTLFNPKESLPSPTELTSRLPIDNSSTEVPNVSYKFFIAI